MVGQLSLARAFLLAKASEGGTRDLGHACVCATPLPMAQSIMAVWPDSRAVLEKLRSELDTSLDKLTTRERFLNDQFERLMQQYRAARQQLTQVQVRCWRCGLQSAHA